VLTTDHTVLPATHTFIHKWNKPHLPLLPSHTASHFGWYTFVILLRVEGWVGLWVAGYRPRWFTRPQTVTHPSTNRARRRITTKPSGHPDAAMMIAGQFGVCWPRKQINTKNAQLSTNWHSYWPVSGATKVELREIQQDILCIAIAHVLGASQVWISLQCKLHSYSSHIFILPTGFL